MFKPNSIYSSLDSSKLRGKGFSPKDIVEIPWFPYFVVYSDSIACKQLD